MNRDDIEKVWLTDTAVWIRTKDGREAFEEFELLPRLKYATKEQREAFELNHFGIRWENVDEDLSYEGFLNKKPVGRLYRIFMSHPELNASAIARRLGIAQSLLAQYISGTKKPSREREESILKEIHALGAELQAIPI
ncbi:MAG: DUF2442 domain-containing protein [Prevotella sp.]|nr:DUF2442 domain-containing protein [Bacteroides sp.]MCM1365740.1 DUF2442 domain-containing protein [Prevotella sp.]MCM1436410.1 DUF2442 domain-containing protein [Prevotella sp.]